MADVKQVAMCPPKYFKVEYEINPWMGGVVDPEKAQTQWDNLKKEIEKCGVNVTVIEPVDGLPDMVFCCNAGIKHGAKFFLSHFRHQERQGERKHFMNWATEQKFQLHGHDEDKRQFFEGGGDAVFSSDDKLWAGFGYRTQKEVYDEIQKMGAFKTIYCQLDHDRYYHLDTCFCPLSDRLALWYPPAFTKESRDRMEREIELIAVSDEEAEKFICNGMAFGKTLIVPPGIGPTKAVVEARGYRVVEVDLAEFMKAGGAVQCLILRL